MNCQDFNYNLHDYLDETLGPEAQAAARDHLRQCAVCRSALLREEKLIKSIRHSLRRATAGLSLRPETRRKVLRALQPKSTPPGFRVWVWQLFRAVPLRPLGAMAALLLLALLLLALQWHRREAERSTSQVATQNRQEDERVIYLPLQTQTHVFHRQNDTIIDAVIPGTAMEHVVFLTRNK